MAKPVKTQWDFGELLPREAVRRVLTVSQLTGQIRRLLEKEVGEVWVTGEVTNLRRQASGHLYFSLKDAEARLQCVLFRGEPVAHRDLLQDGQKVVLRGEVTVYEPRGQYQLRVTEVELQGVGALQQAFERLKQKLNAEGLFAPERKRPLPRYPERIGVVTSPTGAALRDVLHVIERRHAALEIVLAPCRVQGEGAAQEIADAIRLLNQFNAARVSRPSRLDLILLTRGGGSLEDLWAFNEESVARAIFESELPVVSAVGHEIDFTISDFVADVRAATPSAAAEIITDGVYSSRPFVAEAGGRMRQCLRDWLEERREDCRLVNDRLARVHPRRRLQDQVQRLDEVQSTLGRIARHRAREFRLRAEALVGQLARARPAQQLARRRDLLGLVRRRLAEQFRGHWQALGHRWSALETRLRLLSPEQVLARGYSITTDAASGRVLRDAAGVGPGRRLKTRLHKGEVRSVVEG
jgi:exodeoxyribonuclease VII large subunit